MRTLDTLIVALARGRMQAGPMAKRPILPLSTQAAIENARERVLSNRSPYDLIFHPDIIAFRDVKAGSASTPERQRKPANLKIQLRSYSSLLFDSEAQYYARHAKDEGQLLSWLNELAESITNEFLLEIGKHSAYHDFHCPLTERRAAIADALKDRINQWIKAAESDPQAITARERAAIARRGEPISLANLQATRPAGVKRNDETPKLVKATMQPPGEQAARINNKADPKTLRDFYFGSFAEKIVVLDVCWAAKQHYREWIRWIGGKLKDGSKPDMAFRAVLTSGLRPELYRPEATRPKGWK